MSFFSHLCRCLHLENKQRTGLLILIGRCINDQMFCFFLEGGGFGFEPLFIIGNCGNDDACFRASFFNIS